MRCGLPHVKQVEILDMAAGAPWQGGQLLPLSSRMLW